MQTAVKQQRCFVCDNVVTDKCISLLSSKTPLTKVWLPNKIGSIVGDGYAVYVNYDDGLCLSCWNVFKQLDSYENNVEILKTTILQHLRKKYSNEFQKENIKKTVIGNVSGAGKVDKPIKPQYQPGEEIPHWIGQNCRTNEPEAKKLKTGPTFRCSECSFKDGDLNVLRKHITVCEKMTNCKYCNVRISIKNLAKHCSAMHSLFVCKVCNYRASDRNALLSHMKVNHAMNQYEGRTIARATSSAVVNSTTSNSGGGGVGAGSSNSTGQLACTACDFVTNSNEALNAHKHTHGKIFKCNKCSQHYDNFEAIREHAKVHKKVTIYKCGICSATYKDRAQFMEHIVVHVDGKTAKAGTGTGAAAAAAETYQAVQSASSGQQQQHEQQQQQQHDDSSTLMISESAGDLESLLEKISSGTTVNMVPASSDVTAAASTADVTTTTATTTAVLKDESGEEQEVRIAYKCQMCNEVFATSNEYQLHVITACHGQVELNIDDENSDIKLVTNDNGRKQLLMPNGELLDITDADGVFETGDVVMTTAAAAAADGTDGADGVEAEPGVAAADVQDAADAVLAKEQQGSEEQAGDNLMTEAVQNAAVAAAAGEEEPKTRVLDMVSIADDADLEAVTSETTSADPNPISANGAKNDDGADNDAPDSATVAAAAAADCPMDIDEIEDESYELKAVEGDDNAASVDADAAVADEQQPDDPKSKTKPAAKSNKKN